MTQKTIHSVSEFAGTLEDSDSLNRKLLPDVENYLSKMFNRNQIYGYASHASNFACDSDKGGTYDDFGNYHPNLVKLKELEGSCHGQFNHNHSTVTTFFVNWFYRTLHKDACHFFYDWILDPEESPWRGALQNTTVLRDEENDIPVCIIFRNLANEDIHLMTNFLIASRLNTEFHQAEMFEKLVSFGFTKPEAYALCPNFYTNPIFPTSDERYKTVSIFDKTPVGKNPYGKVYENYPMYRATYGNFSSGDRPFYASFDSSRFINKDPAVRVKTPLLKDGHLPNPCNYIWLGGPSAEERTTGQLFNPPKQSPHPERPEVYTGKDMFGFWNQEPKKPSRERIQRVKKLLAIPKSERKERIDLSA